MRTGRRRKKEPEKQPSKPKPSKARPRLDRPKGSAKSSRPRTAPSSGEKQSLSSRLRSLASSFPRHLIWLPILVGLIALVCGIAICVQTCASPRPEPTTYLPATATGSWTTTVMSVADCDERVVDDYDEYVYNIYYEEESDQVYEAGGDEFAVTQLNESEDWWEGDRHYVAQEWLDKETCEYAEYTVWITDPEDPEYEVEVVLAECEVWEHVVVTEGCPPGGSTASEQMFTRQGVGTDVEWPVVSVAGDVEREFEGTVIFRANGATRTVKVTDPNQYMRYLTVPHYLGLDEEGNVVRLTDRAP